MAIRKTVKMVGPDSQEALVAEEDVAEWTKKGFKLEEKPEETPVNTDSRMDFLVEMKLPRLRRLAADLGISEANIFEKPRLIDEILKTEWKPPTE